MSILIESVTKSYGNQLALDKVSFSVAKGEIIGFLGPNGAGKSTLMKIVTGFILPDNGEVFVNENNVLSDTVLSQKSLGYLPEQNPLYEEMYVREYLEFQASIYQVKNTEIQSVIKRVGLQPEVHKKIGQLSKGYKQRVGIAAAILHDPQVLILDEPTTGLDPNQLQDIRDLIKDLGKERTILFSTHIMQEVEAICDRVIIINKGKILLDKPLKELKEDQLQHVEVTFDYKIEEQFIQRLPNLKSFTNNFDMTWYLTFESEEDMRPIIFDFAKENGLKILELSAKNPSLESLFRNLTS